MRKRRYNLFSWVLYDFANSPYSTIMTTLIFPVFFTESIAPGKWGLTAWALLYGGCEVLSAVFSPPLGAMSDMMNRRKRFLVFFTLLAVAGTALTRTLSGGEVFRAVFFFSIAQLGFSLANVFYNSMLAEVSPPERRETVSGIGWGAGYFGGMLFMIAVLLLADMGSPSFQKDSFLFTALWYLAFSIPVFFFFEGSLNSGVSVSFKAGYSEVIGTIKKMSGRKPLFYFLLASFFFNDGVNSAILFGGIFLRKGYGFDDASLFKAFIAFNLIAAAGAWIIGPLADRLSSRRALFLMMWAWILSLSLLPFLSGKAALMTIASVVGILIGGTQSVLRGYLSKLAPAGSQGEWFGFYTLMGKAAALFGPLLFGIFYGLIQDIKLSALSLIPLFLLAGYFLRKVEQKS
ncbi:MAG TPA: MFS transporter [Acidobacteriota bacterium]|nr:MFS transporter [Acidobacteriota bacterium]HNT18399.1 MFS transporter [Acidobacteriota bacterium]